MLARRAIAQVEGRIPSRLVETIRQALGSRTDLAQQFVSRRERASGGYGDLDPAEVCAICKKIATMIDLNGRDAKWIHQIIPFSNDGDVEFRIQLVKGVRAEPVPSDVGNPNGPWYVLDNPGVHSHYDGPTRIRLVIDTTLTPGRLGVYRAGDLAWAKPHAIETAEGKTWGGAAYG